MRGSAHLFIVIPIAIAVLAGGCEATDGGGGGTASSSSSSSSGRYATRRIGSRGTGREFSAGEKATMDAAWRAYLDHSPGWPALRGQWMALGPAATDVLTDNLLRALMVAWLANYPEEADRAKRELILLGDAAVPTVTGVLEDPSTVDPLTGREVKLSTDIVTGLTELLLIAGAEPNLADLAGSEVPSVRRAAYGALGQLETPRGISIVIRVLRGSGDWIDRVAAAKALSYSKTAGGQSALVAALRDREDLVAIEAARSLAVRGDRSALGALDSRRAEARAASNHRLAAAMGAAAKAIREGR